VKNFEESLKALRKHKHCCNCGDVNPEMIHYADTTDEGFTMCCDEDLCDSSKMYRFGDEKISVEACCWAAAELMFKMKGIDISTFESITRFREGGEF
jgi:hypothetical protein